MARNKLNVMLGFAGFQLVRPSEREYVKSYQPFRRTLAEAKKSGLSVGDYIDSKFHVPGATQATVDQMAALGVFAKPIQSVCEIGPGSGRYLERVQRLCRPQSYEIYEPETEWSNWLVRTYGVTAQESDGRRLGNTASDSMDLVHAHKVFVCLPFVITCQYLGEMARVARPGGQIAFDVVTEPCMPGGTLAQWIERAIYYPCIMPRNFVIDLFARSHCTLRNSFFAPMMPGQSEYLVFNKEKE